MISVLIPTYNYDITNLVHEIQLQFSFLKIPHEIIINDDHSTDKEILSKLKTLKGLKIIYSEKNRGLATSRNILAKHAKYKWLLFLDADVIPKSEDFISSYIEHVDIESVITYGGLAYKEDLYTNRLRYKMGIEREVFQKYKTEQLNIHFSNILISLAVFNTVKFDENITTYGHEDTLFHYQLTKKKCQINHINNPVYHLGIDENSVFILKNKSSILNLQTLENKKLIPENFTTLQKTYLKLKKFKLVKLFHVISNLVMKLIISNLKSKKPSLLLFDIYKLNYYCSLKIRHA